MAGDDTFDVGASAAEHDVPGAAVGVLVGTDLHQEATGVLNTDTGVAVTADSLFQIGSITKLWTATLVMQLVGDGVLELDAPVIQYVPGFTTGADKQAAAEITIRQLLVHTSGISDDYTPTTRGDDAIQRYVSDVLAALPTQFPPGEGFSYSNPGYVLLGCIAETVCQKAYSTLLRERISEPLGIRQWASTPEEALLFRAAVGHVPTGDDSTLRPAPVWSMSAAHAPAGSQVAMTAASLLRFASALMRGGQPLVSEPILHQMWAPHPGLPEMGGAGGQLAIGGVIQQAADTTVIAYDGATYGQSASLRILPEKNVAVVSLANGGNLFAFHQAVTSHFVAQTSGVTLPTPPVPPSDPAPVDPARVAGRYRGHDLEVEITPASGGGVSVTEYPLTEELQALLPGGIPSEYVRLDDRRLIGLQTFAGVHPVITISGEPPVPAPSVDHFGRVLHRI
jgi:CubicO group peptidase (beta-lactamase class C family)